MPDDQKFVNVFSVASGRPVRVPAHYLDSPVLGKKYRKTAPSTSVEKKTSKSAPIATAPAPVGDTTKKEK